MHPPRILLKHWNNYEKYHLRFEYDLEDRLEEVEINGDMIIPLL